MIKNVIVNGQVYNGIDKVKLKNNDNKDDYCVFVETSDATATAEDVAAGKITYSNGEKIVGTKVDSGSDTPVVLQSKTVDPKTTQQTITPDSGYTGLSGVTVNAVTNSIDSNIQADNIKKGVSILGVTGTLEQGGGGGETVVTNFPFPHNNIQTGSFTPTEDELSHTITCNFEPKAFICIIQDFQNNPTGSLQYSGAAWYYLSNGKTGNAFTAHRYGGESKGLISGIATNCTVSGNEVYLDANVVNNSTRFIKGRTYNWVAWDY